LQARAGDRVDRAERLVYEHDRRVGRQGARQAHAPLIPASPIEELVFDVLRSLTIPTTLRDGVLQVVQDRLKRATPETADTAALTAQLERLKDLYQMGDLDRNDYVRRRERLQRQLSQAMPPPIRTLDVERATQLLGDLPTLLDAATPTQRRALLRQVLTSVWIEKFAVTAIKPSANFLLLIGTIAGINGDLDWNRPRASKLSARMLAGVRDRFRLSVGAGCC